MKAIKNTYNIVHAMTSSQKRYFKRYMQLYSNQEKEIVQIFNIINKHKKFSEEKIKTDLKQKKIKHTSVKLRYLFDTILDSLAAFEVHSESIDAKLERSIRHARILFEKNFLDKSWSILKKAKEEAKVYERFNILSTILSLELKVLKYGYQYRENGKKILKVVDEKIELYNVLKNFNEYEALNTKIVNIQLQENKKPLEQLRGLLQNEPLLQGITNSLSHNSTQLYYAALTNIHVELGEYEKALELLQEQVDLCQEYPKIFKGEFFVRVINNLLILSLQIDNRKVFFKYIKLIEEKRSENKSKTESALLMYVKYHILIKYYVLNEQSKNIGQLLREVDEQIEIHNNYLQQRSQIVLTFYQAVACIYYNHQDGLLDYLNKIDTLIDSTNTPIEQLMAKILAMFAHLQLGNKSVVDSLIRAVKYFLKKDENQAYNTVFVKLLLKHLFKMNKVLHTRQKGIKDDALLNMDRDLKKHMDKDAAQITSTFNIFIWIESQLKEKNIIDIMWNKEEKIYEINMADIENEAAE